MLRGYNGMAPRAPRATMRQVSGGPGKGSVPEPSDTCLANPHRPTTLGPASRRPCAPAGILPPAQPLLLQLPPPPPQTTGLQIRSELVPWGRQSHGSWYQEPQDGSHHEAL